MATPEGPVKLSSFNYLIDEKNKAQSHGGSAHRFFLIFLQFQEAANNKKWSKQAKKMSRNKLWRYLDQRFQRIWIQQVTIHAFKWSKKFFDYHIFFANDLS